MAQFSNRSLYNDRPIPNGIDIVFQDIKYSVEVKDNSSKKSNFLNSLYVKK
jgi:hypothetical protein